MANFSKFISQARTLQNYYERLLDSIQATRPFYPDLLRLCLKHIHLRFTKGLVQFWSCRKSEISNQEILEFVHLMLKQEKIIDDYGMSDPRYKNSYADLIGTFNIRTYKTVEPLLQNIIDSMQKEYMLEGSICKSGGPTDLFKFINEIFNAGKTTPDPFVAKSILGLIFKLIFRFQELFLKLISETNDVTIEVYCALTNSNLGFIGYLRELCESADKHTELGLEEIYATIQQKVLLKKFGEISNMSFCRIQDLTAKIIAEKVTSLGELKAGGVGQTIEHIFHECKEISSKLLPTFRKKFLRYLLQRFVNLFAQYLIVQSLKFLPSELADYKALIALQLDLIQEAFNLILDKKDVDQRLRPIMLIQSTLVEPPEEIVVTFAHLMIEIKDSYNERCTKCILRIREDIPTKQKSLIVKLIAQNNVEIEKKAKRDWVDLFRRTIMLEVHVHKFIRILKDKVKDRREKQKFETNVRINEELQFIDNSKQREIEISSQLLRGFLSLKHTDMSDPAQILQIVDACIRNDSPWKSYHFSFLEGILMWKKEPTSKKPTMRIFLATINVIGMDGGNIIYFSRGDRLFLLKAIDFTEMKKWAKAIIFLRGEALRDKEFLQFEKFNCVEDSTRLFEGDKADYGIYSAKKEENEYSTLIKNDEKPISRPIPSNKVLPK